MPCGRNVNLWVGGLDVKGNFFPKIDIVGLVRIALLGGREPCFWRSFRWLSGAGWDKFGAAICSSNLLRLCLKLSYVFCSSSGSQVGFHETSTILKVDTAFLFILIQIYTGRAGPWIIGINSSPFSGVAAACFKQALPVVGTVADVTDVHVSKRWGEVWRFKS